MLTQNELFHPSVIERFAEKLILTHLGQNECVEWGSYRNADGYGVFDFTIFGIRIRTTAHRWAFQYAIGGIILPDEIFVCHRCDNPACINPGHMFLGTHQHNMLDMVNKGRSAINFGNSRVNWSIVDEIRQSTETNRAVGERFGIAIDTVRDIRKYRSWKDEHRDVVII